MKIAMARAPGLHGVLMIALAGVAGIRAVDAMVAASYSRQAELVVSIAPPLADLPATPDKLDVMDSATSLPADAARRLNAAQSFVGKGFPAAPPFFFRGGENDYERAQSCLAAAELYEAGFDSVGQQAVAQVVLNRVRHPAYPSTICGVVFQGANRSTGCQFSFTCDGALARRYGTAAIAMAMANARAALAGTVYRQVGVATHYHTDWVRPNWSGSMDKLKAVGTHLFFRWKGFWGMPSALRTNYAGNEPGIAAIIFMSDAHREASGKDDQPVVDGLALSDMAGGGWQGSGMPTNPAALARADVDPASLGAGGVGMDGNRVRVIHPQGGAYLVLLRKGQSQEQFQHFSRRLCGMQDFCHVMGWWNIGDIPPGFPVNDVAKSRLAMQYIYNAATGVDRIKSGG